LRADKAREACWTHQVGIITRPLRASPSGPPCRALSRITRPPRASPSGPPCRALSKIWAG